jgi:hypothetical protein
VFSVRVRVRDRDNIDDSWAETPKSDTFALSSRVRRILPDFISLLGLCLGLGIGIELGIRIGLGPKIGYFSFAV